MKSINLIFSLCIFSFFFSCTQNNDARQINNEAFTDIPFGTNSSLPHLVIGADDQLYISWIEKGDSNLAIFKYSVLQNGSWAEPVEIGRGNDWFVNWADYPMVTANISGNMIGSFPAKSATGTYSYDVNIVQGNQNSDKWSSPMIIHNDGTPTEHGFVTMMPYDNDNFFLSWLDGRNTSSVGHEEHGGGAMTIRTALLDINENISEETELDAKTCDCCQTGGVMTANGPVVVYRDRSDDEIRDIAIVRKVNGKWTQPKIIYEDNWKINGCPVNGPRIDAIDNTLAIAWFSAPDQKPAVKIIFSYDGGENFEVPFVIDDQNPIGRVDVTMIDSNRAAISWLTYEQEKSVIKVQIVESNGTKNEARIIAETSDSRNSGFPQMEKFENDLYFAWTSNRKDSDTEVLIKKIPY